MINNVENKASLNAMSDLEFGKNKVEMMRYRVNGLSYKLGLGGLAFSVLAAFLSLNAFDPNNISVIAKILLNIAILLVGFLCCEKAKTYSKQGSIAMVVLGGICFARIFWIPLQIIITFNAWVNLTAPETADKTSAEYIDYINKKKEYENILGETIVRESGKTVNWLPQDGNFRGGMAIACLVLAALLFITAGITGYIRAKKLATYLESLKEKK